MGLSMYLKKYERTEFEHFATSFLDGLMFAI